MQRFSRREFVWLGLSAASLSASRPMNAAGLGNNKPNIVLINVDDLGWTDLACFGSRYYETPNIDRLASQGMKFSNAYAACAVCSPTRAAIMTGRYPARVGVTDWIHFRDPGAKQAVESGKNPSAYVGQDREFLCPPNPYWMELDEITLAEVLSASGYTSCHVGKWHLGPQPWFPERQGFDLNVGGCDIGQPPSYFDPYYRNAERANIPTLPPRKKGEYLTDREADEAINFIRQHRNQSFFLNLWHYAVHTPIQGKEDLVAKYQAKTPTNHKNPRYAAMIESMDEAVGRIMEALDELELAESTLLIFTSDNGGLFPQATDNTPLRLGKGYPYEGGIRIPQIIRWPGVIKAGTVSETPVSSIDFFPTICEAVGVSLPGDRVIDGESLVPVLEQSGPLKRDALFWHFPHYRGKIAPYSIIRSGNWKLIKRYSGRPYELFNLQDDIEEKRDLADRMRQKVRELDARLSKWLKETEARLPRPNPNYRKKI
ncbi:sulfatase [Acidobacteria bacterium AH-259-O06]|nr:sulfatase [Acidobacteria bacterium AH-259-O06]